MARVEADKLRDETARLRDEVAGLRDEARTLAKALRETQAREKRASRAAGHRARPDHPHRRRPRRRAAPAAGPAGRGRADRRRGPGGVAKEARQVDDARLWLLLETIGQAAIGLRRELALEPTTILPGDFVADEAAATGRAVPTGGERGRWRPTTRSAWTGCSRCRRRTWSSTATT